MTKRIKFIAALMFLASAMCLAQPQAHAAVAPLNPDYVKYMERAESVRPAARSLAANSTENQQNHPVGGYVPSPLDWSHLDGKTWSLPQNGAAQSGGTALARSAANSADALPIKYDLRSKITPVRDQTAFNNCWTHSAMAATESNLIKKRMADRSTDLSEWYLTYYALNPYGDMPGFTNTSGEQYYLVGGNDWKSVALLSRGTGSVTTAKAPDITSYYEYDYATGTAYEDYSQVYTPAVAARDYKLVNALYLGDFAPGKEQWEVQLSAARRDMIKRAITQYGAVSVGIHMGGMNHDNYNSETGAYYSGLAYYVDDPKNGVTTDHAVAIVGWDDGYSRDNFAEANRPQSDGAWIIRNSWGEWWGDGGYCYVSYEEATLCDGVAYDSETARAGENVYQYDPLGCVTWYVPGDPDEAGNVLYFANVFTAEGDDAISSVAFYVPDENIKYEVSIYADCGADSPVSGTLAAAQTAEALVPGYNTVALDSPAEVAEGTRFSVVVRAETPEGGYKMLAPVECAIAGYSDGATANPGEGWLSTDGVNFGDVLALAASEGVTNASICLKAFGERVYTASDAPAPVTGGVTVSDGAAEASVSLISEEKNDEEQSGVISALETETVEDIAPQKNVALLGAFRMNVEHSGGSATFTIKLAEPMLFEGVPYVIIQRKNDGPYRAFRAEYEAQTLTFTVDSLDDYFSEAVITIADVKDSAKPAPHGGSGGGCSAGWGALALFAVVPLALKKKTK